MLSRLCLSCSNPRSTVPQLPCSLPSRGGNAERFVPGSERQITLKRTPERYPDFDIRNLASNGDVWTGVGDETKAHFPPLETLKPEDYPTENKCSLAIRLRYGKFSYFSAGDQDHEVRNGRWPWGDIEAATARASGKVQVAVADHHGYTNACSPDWVRALQPKAFVINGWIRRTRPSMLSTTCSTRIFTQDLDWCSRLLRNPRPRSRSVACPKWRVETGM